MNKAVKSLPNKDARIVMSFMYVAFTALFVGASAGLIQTLERSGKFKLPAGSSYYQILTVNGVVLGLVLTTIFILGVMLASISNITGGCTLARRILTWYGRC